MQTRLATLHAAVTIVGDATATAAAAVPMLSLSAASLHGLAANLSSSAPAAAALLGPLDELVTQVKAATQGPVQQHAC